MSPVYLQEDCKVASRVVAAGGSRGFSRSFRGFRLRLALLCSDFAALLRPLALGH